jgi:xylulokinase
MSYVLGIDLGTGSLKGILMNKEGKVVAEASSSYEILNPAPGFSEQHPEFWITATEQVLTKLSIDVKDFGTGLEAISFSGQMHSLVALGEDNRPVRPAILWNDVRTTAQCKQIMDSYGSELLSITKNVALEGFTLPKILWMQQNEPDVWAKVRNVMMPKDYLAFWFTDEIHCEYSDASGTLMFDEDKEEWSAPICEKFNISMDVLPPLVQSMDMVGLVSESIKKRFNITADVKVFAGGADNACAALGAGLVTDDIAQVSIGTSGVFSCFEPAPVNYQGKMQVHNHVMPNSLYSMGVTLAAGDSLTWFKNAFGRGMSFEEFLSEVYTVAPGSNGLLFTPYIVGERAPHMDSKIRGSFVGIDTTHELKHFARAVMEGITFSLKDCQMLMEAAKGKHFSQIISVGGGAKNPDWMQIQADVFNAEIIRLSVEQGPGAGACMIAAIGAGWFENSVECAKAFVSYKEAKFTPKPENVAKYEAIYAQYKEVYNGTKDICHALVAENEKEAAKKLVNAK